MNGTGLADVEDELQRLWATVHDFKSFREIKHDITYLFHAAGHWLAALQWNFAGPRTAESYEKLLEAIDKDTESLTLGMSLIRASQKVGNGL